MKSMQLFGISIATIGVLLASYVIAAKPPSTAQIQTAKKSQVSSKPAKPRVKEIFQPVDMRPLPGGLDQVPLFNSNSPEWLKTSGILLSSFPGQGKAHPTAHLNYPLEGEFNLFAHHFTHDPRDRRTLYIGVLAYNPGRQPVTIEMPAAASYRLVEDAPFQSQPQILDNADGSIFSGPGIRAVDTVLRGQRTAEFSARVVVPPGQYRLLLNGDIATKGLKKPVNGRSTFMRLKSSDKVYVASLSMLAPKTAQGNERKPTLREWQTLLEKGNLAKPRGKTPTKPGAKGVLIYGRVAGIQSGANWKVNLTDPGRSTLELPPTGQSIAYGLSTVRAGRMGTGQIQSAPLLVRYPDTAYAAHGNYATYYDFTLPLSNSTAQTQTVAIKLSSPIKQDRLSQNRLRFQQPTKGWPYFRGTIRIRYEDEQRQTKTRYRHLWHRIGEVVDPLLKLKFKPQEQRSVRIDFYYPPDSTPPQVLSVTTIAP